MFNKVTSLFTGYIYHCQENTGLQWFKWSIIPQHSVRVKTETTKWNWAIIICLVLWTETEFSFNKLKHIWMWCFWWLPFTAAGMYICVYTGVLKGKLCSLTSRSLSQPKLTPELFILFRSMWVFTAFTFLKQAFTEPCLLKLVFNLKRKKGKKLSNHSSYRRPK